jgi:DnaJ-class molecular chaperone
MIDGSWRVLAVPGTIPHGWTITLSGHGMPTSDKARNQRGDLLVRVAKIRYPVSLAREQIQGVAKIIGVEWYGIIDEYELKEPYVI